MSVTGRAAGRVPIRPSTEAIQAALERDLIEWADDVSLRLVWADLLQIDGDPLGRLVLLDHFGETNPAIRPEAEALRESLRTRLEIPREPEFTLRWERGFVQTLEVRPRRSDARTMAKKIHDALRRPALRFLECLHVIVPDTVADPWPGAILWSTSHPTLRELHVGDPPRLRERPSGAYEPGRGQRRHDYSARGESLTKFPRLRWASVAGELIRLACRDGSTETRKHHIDKLATRPLTSQNRTSLIRAIWDPSALVQDAAFATIVKLGPRAEFVIDDLELLLRPPLGDRDPRPAQAFAGLAAIGAASAGMLADVLARDLEPIVGRPPRRNADDEVRTSPIIDARCVAFLGWVRALGRAGRPALKVVDKLLASKPKEISAQVRGAAKSARKALLAE
jgi:hypothetical protein